MLEPDWMTDTRTSYDTVAANDSSLQEAMTWPARSWQTCISNVFRGR